MKKMIFVMIVVFFLLSQFSFSQVKGKVEKTVALGKYDFYHYYTYEELTSYLKDLNKAFPGLTELISLCQSPLGREVWMLVVNNPKTGKAEDKPGVFLNQIHAGEVIASMSCAFTLWHLLSNYEKNEQITGIVDNLVWYVVPRLDVDGAEAYLLAKPAGQDPDPIDNDGDGKFDEDPAEDIDGDGFIVQMRKKDPKGEMKISKEDPRMMVRKAADEISGTFYKLYTEGIDNDGDGKINEDGFRQGFLSNRNYPGNWRPKTIQQGGGNYPLEERITRAEVDFVAKHPNIAIYIQHHCCGRVILRPPTTQLDKDFMNKGDLELYKIVSARSLEQTGWDLATSVLDWDYPPETGNKKSTQIFRDKDGKIKNAPVGVYEEREENEPEFSTCCPDDEYQFDHGYFAWGSSLETMYELFGIFSMADEHWSSPDYDRDGEISDKERFRWNDEEMKGKMFINWHPFNHPTLGEVEIGGWLRSKTSPPEGELIQKECEMGNRYVIYLASLAPKLKIGGIEVMDKKGGIYQVDITVMNTGFLPTATEQAQHLEILKPVLLEVEPDDNLEIILGEKKEKLGQIKGNSESKKSTLILRLKDSSKKSTLKVSVSSQNAGKDSKEVVIQ